MTFLVCDGVQVDAGTVTVGGHLLRVQSWQGRLTWQLHCPSCPAVLSAGVLQLDGRLLAGAQCLPAQPGTAMVSWAWGATPPAGSVPAPQVCFAGGLRRAAVAPAHLLPAGLWVAAAPGGARRAIAVAGGSSGELRVDMLTEQDCPGLPGRLLTGRRRGRHSRPDR